MRNDVYDGYGFEDWEAMEELSNIIEYWVPPPRERLGPSYSMRKFYIPHAELTVLGAPVDELHGPHVPGLERLEELGVM